MESNLPAKRSMEQILAADTNDLTHEEIEARDLYLTEVGIQQTDQSSHIARPLQIKVAHEIQTFQFPDESTAKSFGGVILGSVITRGLYQGKGEDSVMLCSSIGGRIGTPTQDGINNRPRYLTGPNMSCGACPANMWGSADEGEGKDCKEMRKLLIFLRKFAAPLSLSVSPTSLANYDEFRDACNAAGKPVAGHVTEIWLEGAGPSSQRYSKMFFKLGDPISPDQFKIAVEIRERFRKSLEVVEEDDYFQVQSASSVQSGVEDTVNMEVSSGEPPPMSEEPSTSHTEMPGPGQEISPDDDLPF